MAISLFFKGSTSSLLSPIPFLFPRLPHSLSPLPLPARRPSISPFPLFPLTVGRPTNRSLPPLPPQAQSLTLEGVDRHVEGTYLCTADNGIGEAAVAAMSIIVEYPPEITTEKARDFCCCFAGCGFPGRFYRTL